MDIETKSLSCERKYEIVATQDDIKSESNSEEENENIIVSEINIEENNEKEAARLETEEDANKFSDVPQIQISKRKNIIFNRRLIPLRIAVILLAGGGRLPGLFLSVFLRSRGMSLIGLSAIISITSFSEVLGASVSGIIADKTGNTKAVLIVLIAGTAIFCVCLLLTPSMKQDACDKPNTDFNDLNELKNITKSRYLDNCTYTCPGNNGDFLHVELVNKSLISELGIDIKVYQSSKKLFNINKSDENFTTDFYLLNTSVYDNFTENCSFACSISQKDCQTKEMVLFIFYIITFLYLTFRGTTYRFMDVTIMSLVKEHSSNYGNERVFGIISDTAVSAFVAFGMDLLDFDTFSQNKYDLVYWTCAALMILAIIASCNFKAQINAPGKRLTAKALILVKNIEFIVFLMIIFITGIASNFYMYFNLLLLEDIKAEKIVFGLSNTMFSFCAIPGLLTSKWWLQKLGAYAIILIYLFSNSLIAFAYFSLHNPWLCLILEGARGFVFNLFLVSVLQRCQDIAPIGLASTVTAVSLAIHYAFGRAAATFGGGLLMNAVGSRTTYKLTGALCFVTGIAYGVFLFVCRGKRKHPINVPEI